MNQETWNEFYDRINEKISDSDPMFVKLGIIDIIYSAASVLYETSKVANHTKDIERTKERLRAALKEGMEIFDKIMEKESPSGAYAILNSAWVEARKQVS